MAGPLFVDRTVERTASSGVLATIDLTGAVTGFKPFLQAGVIAVNDTFHITIKHVSLLIAEWQVCEGTLTGASEITVGVIFSSSNNNAAVNFSAGDKYVILDASAELLTEMLYGTITTTRLPIIPISKGGLGADFSAGGGSGFVVKQAAGGAFSSAALLTSDIPSLDAAKITTGTFDNARVNWAAPGTLGSTTPNTIAGTTAIFSGNLTVDTDTFFVNAANNHVGVGTLSPVDVAGWGGGNQRTRLWISDLTASSFTALGIQGSSGGAIQFINSSGAAAADFGWVNGGEIGFANRANAAINFYTNGANNRMSISGGGGVGIGTTTPATLLHILTSDAVTNTVTNILTLTHNSTGTATNGFGAGISTTMESSATNSRAASLIETIWNDATDSAAIPDLNLIAYHNAAGTLTRRVGFTVRGGASAVLTSVNGATPVARATAGAATAGVLYTATEQTMLQIVYDAVRAFGITT